MGNNDFTEEDLIEALKTSGTGIWRLEAQEGVHTRFYGDRYMNILLGVSDEISPEERYDFFMSRVHKEDLDLFMDYYMALKEQNQAEVVYRYDHPERGVIYVRCGGKKSFVKGSLVCYRGFHMDVTNTIRIEQETKHRLTEQAELFRAIAFKMMEHTTDSTARIDSETGELEWLLLSGERIYDTNTYDEIILGLSNNVPEENRTAFVEMAKLDTIRKSLSQKTVYSFSTLMYRETDGELRRSSYWYYKMDKDNKILCIYKDTTEDYEKEKQLEEALLESKQANRAKTVFLNNMSHDIRTPMNAIIGFTDLAEKHLDDPDKCKDYLGKIRVSSQHLLSLINDVLDMSRIESGRVVLKNEDCWICELMEGLSTILTTDAQNKGLDFSIDYSMVSDKHVYCDRLRLNQVLLNCASNSVKFTEPGGKISIKVVQLDSKNENADRIAHYVFTISDTGIGMSEDFLTHIFEPFSRAEDKVRHIEGTGLGMSICKNMVDLMGGTISVESKLGEGTTFTIDIPFEKIDNPSDNAVIVGEEESPVSIEGKRILLAEDNDLNAEIAQAVLEDAGAIMERAADGKICIDMLTKADAKYYDLILMDVRMPNMDGYTATKVIRSMTDDRKNIPIVAMTANAFEEDKQEAISIGMNGHLAKPVRIDELVSLLGSILR